MEEKVIISGKSKPSKNILAYVFLGIGIILFIIAFSQAITQYNSGTISAHHPYFGTVTGTNKKVYDTFFEFFFDRFSYYGYGNISLIALAFCAIGILLILLMNRCIITVSDKRICGKTSFAQNVDLPISSISSVSTGGFSSISLTSASKKAKFWLLDNRTEIYKTISELLSNSNDKTTNRNDTIDNMESIKKIKELLDMGIISQEEFEEKKKQLLGL